MGLYTLLWIGHLIKKKKIGHIKGNEKKKKKKLARQNRSLLIENQIKVNYLSSR